VSYDWYATLRFYGSSETRLAAARDRAIVPDYAICINGFSGPRHQEAEGILFN